MRRHLSNYISTVICAGKEAFVERARGASLHTRAHIWKFPNVSLRPCCSGESAAVKMCRAEVALEENTPIISACTPDGVAP